LSLDRLLVKPIALAALSIESIRAYRDKMPAIWFPWNLPEHLNPTANFRRQNKL
jgi:hypothetical protein